ncbi:MAG: OmpA family protein [Balneolaceae bacterium]
MKIKKISYVLLYAVIMSVTSNAVMAQSSSDLYNSGKYNQAAIKYEQSASSSPEHYLWAARSYTALKDWDKAIQMYEAYSSKYSKADKAEINTIIGILSASEEDVYAENLGLNINSEQDEYLARVSSDGNRLYYNIADKPGGFGGEDAWYSTKKPDGTWSTPFNMGPVINTTSHEGILSISSDGNTAIVFGNYEGRFGGGDLFYSSRIGDSWTVPCNLGGDINSKNWDSMASLSPDGKTMLFVAYEGRKTKEEANYKTDIYITHLKNGRWTTPVPLPRTINTAMSEVWPFLNSDGRTLYFSSKGHPGLGGYDLFMSRRIGDGWDNWTTPVNLGKSINSVLDDSDLTVPASGTVAYFKRETTGEGDGYGKDDIFRLILPASMRPDPVVTIYGNITNQNDSLIAATLFWSDFDSGEQLGYSTSNPKTGDYLINLPFGRRYLITANQKGYLFQSEMLDLKTMVEDSIIFSEKLGPELFRMQNALKRIDQNKSEYEKLLASNSSELEGQFTQLSELSKEMNKAQADLNDAIRRARISYLEDNSGYKEVRQDISLTEANEGARVVLENIYFDTGSATLRNESQQELDRLFEIMTQSTLVIEIGGYTDNVGSDETNMTLSQARAESVVSYVVNKGISNNRISAKGYGKNDPRANNETAEGRQENRRVEIKVLSSGSQEGTGGLLAEQTKEVPSTDNLYELYRQAAIAGGTPKGAACYDSNNYNPNTIVTSNREKKPRKITTRTTSHTWYLDSSGKDVSAFSGRSISFISHSGGGTHGYSNLGGSGVGLYSSSGRGERNLWGYFLGDAIGGGIEWNRYKDMSGLVKLPVSFDYGFGAYFVYNKTTTDFGPTPNKLENYAIGMGVPIMLRLRYNIELADIKVSPYASYHWNALNMVNIDASNKVQTNGDIINTTSITPTWVEFGARAKYKFITVGLGAQSGGGGVGSSGVMLRAGLNF